jgi:hypothetical protein
MARVHDLFIQRLVEEGIPKIMRSYRTALGKNK